MVSNWKETREKSAFFFFITCLLRPAERQALSGPAHRVDVDQVFRVCCESRQGEVVPGRRQPLVLGPPAADHLVTDAVAGDFALGSEPVDGEGVGEDLRETQADWGIQSWKKAHKKGHPSKAIGFSFRKDQVMHL